MTKKPDLRQNLLSGHRERMRAKIIDQGYDSLRDDEILEMLLFYAIPRKDTKLLAKELIKKFGSLERVIFSPPEKLTDIKGVTETTVALFMMMQRMKVDFKLSEIIDRTIMSNWQSVIDFCRAKIGFLEKEVFAVIFLNNNNVLISYEEFSEGTVDKVSVYPREIMELAITKKAGAVILVHNHPTGNVSPSKQDIEMTRSIRDALKTVNITLHDHLIISDADHSSFKSLGLI